MTGEPIVFLDAVLRPNPPLGRRAMVLVLAAVAIANFAFGMLFVLQGAWPVMPFMGLDVLALAWAFRASRRAARGHERIIVRAGDVEISRVPASGAPSATHFNPYWLQVRITEDMEQPRHLLLSSHGRTIELGRFLAPEERVRFAAMLKNALHAARNWRGD